MSPDAPDTPRYFSLDEANRMLPLVRRIVDDIMEQWGRLEPLVESWQVMAPDEKRGPAGRSLKADLDARTAELDGLMAELQDLGCHFKGVDEGLVDWFSHYAGRPVFLCWKRGEESIEWWHQVDGGFAGRQPILDSQRGAFSAS